MPPETGRAFAAIKPLRPDLVDEKAFARQVEEVQRPEGYRLLATSPQARAGDAQGACSTG